jgi:hypothetical protein
MNEPREWKTSKAIDRSPEQHRCNRRIQSTKISDLVIKPSPKAFLQTGTAQPEHRPQDGFSAPSRTEQSRLPDQLPRTGSAVPAELALQHRELMPQSQDLGVLVAVAARQQPQRGERVRGSQIPSTSSGISITAWHRQRRPAGRRHPSEPRSFSIRREGAPAGQQGCIDRLSQVLRLSRNHRARAPPPQVHMPADNLPRQHWPIP